MGGGVSWDLVSRTLPGKPGRTVLHGQLQHGSSPLREPVEVDDGRHRNDSVDARTAEGLGKQGVELYLAAGGDTHSRAVAARAMFPSKHRPQSAIFSGSTSSWPERYVTASWRSSTRLRGFVLQRGFGVRHFIYKVMTRQRGRRGL